MSAPPARDQSDRGRWWVAGVIAVAIAFAVVVSFVRARSGSVDLWYDDSWVAFSTRVPLSEAIRIGVTAPGFTVIVRWWMGLAAGSIGWAQSFALIGLVLAPLAVFVAARTAGATRWAATTVACLTAVNPMLLAQSSRVKQYTWEFALSALMIALAAAVRRDGPTTRWTLSAAVIVVAATLFSASMLIPSALLFLVLAVGLWTATRDADDSLPMRDAIKRLALLAVAGIIVLAAAVVLLRRSPPALKASYLSLDGFIGSSRSVSATVKQAWALLRGFFDGFFFGGSTLLLVIPVAALVWFAWRRWRTAWWLLMAPVFAVVLSATQRYPMATIGYSRVVAWLMPWIAVLLALALTEIGSLAEVRDFVARIPGLLKIAVVGLAALGLAVVAWNRTATYPPTRARAALQILAAASATGPTYVIYEGDPVNVVAPGPLRFVNDRQSLQGYSVAGLGGGLRVLHLYPADVAARELRPACGHTAAIAGADPRAVAAALPFVGCRVLQQSVDTQGTSRVDDDTVVVKLGPPPA